MYSNKDLLKGQGLSSKRSVGSISQRKKKKSPPRSASIQGDIIWRLAESGVAELFIEICFANSATGIRLGQETLRYPDMALHRVHLIVTLPCPLLRFQTSPCSPGTPPLSHCSATLSLSIFQSAGEIIEIHSEGLWGTFPDEQSEGQLAMNAGGTIL